METVLEALKAMGKATARELAARMKIDLPDVMAMLREHDDLGQVEHVNGWWQLVGKKAKTPRVKSAAPEVKVAPRKQRTTPPLVANNTVSTTVPGVAEVVRKVEPEAPAPAPAPQSDAAFLDAIPQMAKRRATEMACPTPKAIAAEIRRTKSRLNQLEELRVTVRQLARQQRALRF